MCRVDAAAFHDRPSPEQQARFREELSAMDCVGVHLDGELVGVAAARSLQLTFPGGELDVAGITSVAVLPTHRRRGVLRALMGELLERAGAAGQPMAALFAAEGGIYGRFGFGAATRMASLRVDARAPLGLRVSPSQARMRLLDGDDALAAIRPLHDEVRSLRPGRPARDATWWANRTLRDNPQQTPVRTVVLGEPGDEEGYAVYDTSIATFPSDRVQVRVRQLEARTPAAEAALWRYLTSIDLADEVVASLRPEDDRLLSLAANPDQVVVSRLRPGLWARLLDAPAVLAAREWAHPPDLVLELRDEDRSANAGRWHLTPGACVETRAAPDIVVGVRELSGACFGAPVAMLRAANAGLVEERTTGTVLRLDAALALPRAPFAPEYW